MSINCKVILGFETARFSFIGDFFRPGIHISLKLRCRSFASSGLTDCQKKVQDVRFGWPQYL